MPSSPMFDARALRGETRSIPPLEPRRRGRVKLARLEGAAPRAGRSGERRASNRKAKRRRPTFIRAFREKNLTLRRRSSELSAPRVWAQAPAGSRGSPARRDECRASGRGGGVAAPLGVSRVRARDSRGESDVSFRTRRARRVEVPRATASREPGRHSARGGAAMARLEVFPRARRGRCARTRFGCVQRRRERADELPRRRPKARDEAQLGGRPRGGARRRGGRRRAEPAGHRGRAAHSEGGARDSQPRPPQRAPRPARARARAAHRGIRDHGDLRAGWRRRHRAAAERIP